MKLNLTHKFFKAISAHMVKSLHILMVQSLAQGLPSKCPGERAARGAGVQGGSWREQDGQLQGQLEEAGGASLLSLRKWCVF